MPEPKVVIQIDVRQLRDNAGRFARYSHELFNTRLRPWAIELGFQMTRIAMEEIPSETLKAMLTHEIEFVPTPPGQGTRVTIFPESREWDLFAQMLLTGAKPHDIDPKFKKALWWEAGVTKIKKKPYSAPSHPLRRRGEKPAVRHPGFEGDDYISRIEKRALEEGVLGIGGVANKFGKNAELTLVGRRPPTPAGFRLVGGLPKV